MEKITVLIKGAGDIASGVAWRLHQCHMNVLMTETEKPLAVRRAVSFCEAVYDGQQTVEGVKAALVKNVEESGLVGQSGGIPIFVDPGLDILDQIRPHVLVEATLSKRNTGVDRDLASLVIALGPGYEAPKDAHFVIETNRGHNLGRVISQGCAQENTGVPGDIKGISKDRVLRSPADGIFQTQCKLGDHVESGQTVAEVDGAPLKTRISGVLRGLIRPGIEVKTGLKVGDVDPRGDAGYVGTISEKARAVGGSVLEAIMRVYNR